MVDRRRARPRTMRTEDEMRWAESSMRPPSGEESALARSSARRRARQEMQQSKLQDNVLTSPTALTNSIPRPRSPRRPGHGTLSSIPMQHDKPIQQKLERPKQLLAAEHFASVHVPLHAPPRRSAPSPVPSGRETMITPPPRTSVLVATKLHSKKPQTAPLPVDSPSMRRPRGDIGSFKRSSSRKRSSGRPQSRRNSANASQGTSSTGSTSQSSRNSISDSERDEASTPDRIRSQVAQMPGCDVQTYRAPSQSAKLKQRNYLEQQKQRLREQRQSESDHVSESSSRKRRHRSSSKTKSKNWGSVKSEDALGTTANLQEGLRECLQSSRAVAGKFVECWTVTSDVYRQECLTHHAHRGDDSMFLGKHELLADERSQEGQEVSFGGSRHDEKVIRAAQSMRSDETSNAFQSEVTSTDSWPSPVRPRRSSPMKIRSGRETPMPMLPEQQQILEEDDTDDLLNPPPKVINSHRLAQQQTNALWTAHELAQQAQQGDQAQLQQQNSSPAKLVMVPHHRHTGPREKSVSPVRRRSMQLDLQKQRARSVSPRKSPTRKPGVEQPDTREDDHAQLRALRLSMFQKGHRTPPRPSPPRKTASPVKSTSPLHGVAPEAPKPGSPSSSRLSSQDKERLQEMQEELEDTKQALKDAVHTMQALKQQALEKQTEEREQQYRDRLESEERLRKEMRNNSQLLEQIQKLHEETLQLRTSLAQAQISPEQGSAPPGFVSVDSPAHMSYISTDHSEETGVVLDNCLERSITPVSAQTPLKGIVAISPESTNQTALKHGAGAAVGQNVVGELEEQTFSAKLSNKLPSDMLGTSRETGPRQESSPTTIPRSPSGVNESRVWSQRRLVLKHRQARLERNIKSGLNDLTQQKSPTSVVLIDSPPSKAKMRAGGDRSDSSAEGESEVQLYELETLEGSSVPRNVAQDSDSVRGSSIVTLPSIKEEQTKTEESVTNEHLRALLAAQEVAAKEARENSEAERRELLDRTERLDKELTAMKNETIRLRAQLAEANAALESAKNKNEDLQTENAGFRSETRQLRSEVEELRRMVESIRSQKSDDEAVLKTEVNLMRTKLAKTESDVMEKEAERRRVEEILTETRSEADELRGKVSKYFAQLEETKQASGDELRCSADEARKLQDELQRMKQKLSETNAEIVEQAAQHLQQRKQLEEELEQTKETSQLLQQKVSNLDDLVAAAESEAEYFRSQAKHAAPRKPESFRRSFSPFSDFSEKLSFSSEPNSNIVAPAPRHSVIDRLRRTLESGIN